MFDGRLNEVLFHRVYLCKLKSSGSRAPTAQLVEHTGHHVIPHQLLGLRFLFGKQAGARSNLAAVMLVKLSD
jgi:hypothetical protein